MLAAIVPAKMSVYSAMSMYAEYVVTIIGSAGAVVLIDVDEAIGVGERLSPEQHRVHDAEDRGVGADGDAEDQHRRRREPPVAHEAPQSVSRIAHERIPGTGPARIAGRFLDLLDAAEQPPRLEARLLARQAGRLQTLGLAFEMELQFFVQIGFAAARGRRSIGACCG